MELLDDISLYEELNGDYITIIVVICYLICIRPARPLSTMTLVG